MTDTRGRQNKSKKKQRPDKKRAVKQAARFKGWDWTEMGPVFGLDISDDSSLWSRVLCDRIWRAVLIAEQRSDVPATMRERINARTQIQSCRAFLLQLAKAGHGYDSAVWKAIAEIRDDEVFAQWLTHYLEAAWS